MTTTINGSGSADFATALPVAEGGTGATASTGSGNVVLSTSPTLTGTIGAAALTLTTPLPVASGGTGNTQGGKLVRNHYINSTGSYQDIGPTNTMTAVGCTANISVTAGNILTVWWQLGLYATNAGHWAGTAFLDSTSMGHGNWGDGIIHGTGTVSGWVATTGQNRIAIPTTKTASLSLRMTCNVGSVRLRRDGNLGYDGAYMIVQETTP